MKIDLNKDFEEQYKKIFQKLGFIKMSYGKDLPQEN